MKVLKQKIVSSSNDVFEIAAYLNSEAAPTQATGTEKMKQKMSEID